MSGRQTDSDDGRRLGQYRAGDAALAKLFIGRMAFYNLRQAVQRRDGDEFDFGEFHEAVLNQGTIPVKYLPELFGVASESDASWGLFVRFREIRECSFHE